MVRMGMNLRTTMPRRALSAVGLLLVILGGSVAHAQSVMRSPSLHIDSRVPTINPMVTPRVNPTMTGRGEVGVNTIARMPPIRDGGGARMDG